MTSLTIRMGESIYSFTTGTASVSAVQAAVNSHAYDVIEFAAGTYTNLSGLAINVKHDRPLVIRAAVGAEVAWNLTSSIAFTLGAGVSVVPVTLSGLTIHQATYSTPAIDIPQGCHKIRVEGCTITGPGSYPVTPADWAGTPSGDYESKGINVNVSYNQTAVDSLAIVGNTFSNWAGSGIWLRNVTNFVVTDNVVTDCCFSGIEVLAGITGSVLRNDVSFIGFGKHSHTLDGAFTGMAANAYGIYFDRSYGDPATTDPLPTDIDCGYNTVTDIPHWHGLDAHCGLRIDFNHNTVERVRRASFITTSSSWSPEPKCTDIVTYDNDFLAPGGTDGQNDNIAVTLVGNVGHTITYNYVRGWGTTSFPYDIGGSSTGLVVNNNDVAL